MLSRVIKAHHAVVQAPPPVDAGQHQKELDAALTVERDRARARRARIAAGVAERAEMMAQIQREARRLLRQSEKFVERRMAELAEAEARLDQEREHARLSGHREGYQQGYQEGLEKGRAEGVAAVGQLLADARAVLEEAQRMQARLVEQTEKEIVQLALAVAEKLVRQSLATDEDAVLSIIKGMIAKVDGSATARVRVPREVFARFEGEWQSLASYAHGDCRLEFSPDDGLAQGDVIIETDWGMIDGRIQGRWQRIVQGLDLVRQSDDDSD